MQRLMRSLRHAWADVGDVRRVVDDAAAQRITARVAASERLHRGEIRVCIEAGLPWAEAWQGRSVRQRAVDLFSELRVWDTAGNNGVLVYVLLADRAIEIVADRGVAPVAGADGWQPVIASMRTAFQEGRFEAGVMQAIDAIEATLLAQQGHARPEGDNPNELPDPPVRR